MIATQQTPRSADDLATQAIQHLGALLEALKPEALWPDSDLEIAARNARAFLKAVKQ